MSARLFIGNLSPDTTGDELRALFSEIGEVESCQLLITGETRRPKSSGFIEMNSKEAANLAREKFNGQVLHGRALKVSIGKPGNKL